MIKIRGRRRSTTRREGRGGGRREMKEREIEWERRGWEEGRRLAYERTDDDWRSYRA